jgi:hypothetical protein
VIKRERRSHNHESVQLELVVRVDDWADSVKPTVTDLECASCRGRSLQFTSAYWVDLCTYDYGTTLSASQSTWRQL